MCDFPILQTLGDPHMKRKRYTGEQIIKILKKHQGGAPLPELSCHHGIAENTFYHWMSMFGGMVVSDAKRFREL